MDMYEIFKTSEKMAMDDTVDFECTRCGACCKNINNIILNPMDIFKAAQYMGLSNEKFISSYCQYYIGNDSKLMVVRIKPSDTCPFYADGQCDIHPFKPTLCKLYPMGRMQVSEDKLVYFLQNVPCGKLGKPILLRDWLHKNDLTADDPFGKLWRDTIVSLAVPLVTHPLPIQMQIPLYTAMYELLYCRYVKGDDFYTWFNLNVTELKKFYKELKII